MEVHLLQALRRLINFLLLYEIHCHLSGGAHGHANDMLEALKRRDLLCVDPIRVCT